MNLAEFLVQLHYEVQKSYDYTATLAKEGRDAHSAVLQISQVEVDLEIPAVFRRALQEFDPSTLKGLPLAYKLLVLPFPVGGPAPVGEVPKRPYRGQSIDLEPIGPNKREDRQMRAEMIGRLKIVLKPVLK